MANPEKPTASDVEQMLQAERRSRRRKRWIYFLLLLLLTGAVIVAWLYFQPRAAIAVQYKTEKTLRGDLTETVTATGVLQPVVQVDVGTEVSGTVERVEVDFNQRVKKGQVLARLNTDQLEARRRQSEAALALAKARVAEALATVNETSNRLLRGREMLAQNLYSQEELDTLAAANARAEAALDIAKAQVNQAQAQLDVDTTAITKAVIRSPIDGIVLTRQVEPGQTVAASLQTPVLFGLAENLSQMELHVAVDEADIGEIREGQNAVFTVDAYKDRQFPATISQVRFAPQTVEGVVTYETILLVDNSDLALRPGMTATAEITVNVFKDALLVPNTALRFSPPRSNGNDSSRGLVASLFSRRPSSSTRRTDTNTGGLRHRVWVLQQGEPVAVPVRIGASDGRNTQILAGELEAGTPVLVDVLRTGKKS